MHNINEQQILLRKIRTSEMSSWYHRAFSSHGISAIMSMRSIPTDQKMNCVWLKSGKKRLYGNLICYYGTLYWSPSHVIIDWCFTLWRLKWRIIVKPPSLWRRQKKTKQKRLPKPKGKGYIIQIFTRKIRSPHHQEQQITSYRTSEAIPHVRSLNEQWADLRMSENINDSNRVNKSLKSFNPM